MFDSGIIAFAFIGLISFASQWLAWRVKLPAILFLLASGLLIGPVTQQFNPDALFGDLLFPLISLAVAIILFEGSLTLDLKEIRSQKGVVQRLITVGAGITWAVVAIATHYLFGLSWELSILFGALTVVTGPTVIVPMLRTVRPNADVGNILRWEGILIDPLGALLVVVVYEFIVAQGQAQGAVSGMLAFVEIIASGTVLGLAAGWILGFILKRRWVPEYLENMATLTMVFLSFSVANMLAHESGLLAVTLMGMWLANQKDIRIGEILNFKEHLTVLLISGLFIILAARLTLDDLIALGWMPFALLAIMQFVARPLSVWVSAIGSTLSWQEKSLLSWIAPRGIVAAAVSALFAIKLEQSGETEAAILVPLTFSVIFGTVVLQSATSRMMARWLGVAEPPPNGFLIVGANNIARTIALELKKNKVDVLLTDSNWDNIRAARMDGLRTFYGNPVSEYAEQRLDLVGLGKLLGLSPERSINTVAGMRFGNEFGQHNIYALRTSVDARLSEMHIDGEEHRGQYLFSKDLTYSKFSSMLAQGAELHSTRLSSEFTWNDFQQQNGKDAIPLFAITPEGKVLTSKIGSNFEPKNGWKVISLFTPALVAANDQGASRTT
ncbi:MULTISPECIES: cation:proton antiporter [Thalassolituus]|uniref:cation:proton antiporter n=1 Tax=Thalassolituus TaxID=187492 RepID=UPI0007CF4B84|nr:MULTISPECIES: sodium:proton antiporter [Thalassolituus]KZZ11739.1 sodium:proton antiporter [Oleibacter sp. HI0075]MAX85448.1 sodium:proton antiporter [Oceanospirillaceae bacterium]